MPDYWTSCGYRLLTRGGDGRLTVTDDFLRSYLTRPELSPIPESCAAELALHDALLANPRRSVPPADLAAVADADARENYGIWLRFRARLVGANSLEAAYVGLFQGEGVDVPPQFVAELTQVLLRHILGDDAAPMEARAAEMLFRTQKIAVTEDGAVMSADEATVELFATTAGFGSLRELLAQNRTPARSVDLEVMDAGNAAEYWGRDERHDFSVSLNRGQPALDALTRETLQQDLVRLCSSAERPVTTVMITNNVEEALLLSDRIVPMLPGPPATLGAPIPVELPRPRTTAQLAHEELATHVRAHVVATLTAAMSGRLRRPSAAPAEPMTSIELAAGERT